MHYSLYILLFIFFATSCNTSFIKSGHKEYLEILKTVPVSELPSELVEISGLVYFNGMLLGMNDGGNPSELYSFLPSSPTIKSTFNINRNNRDWEALSLKDSIIYIADTGNNIGTREELSIYKYYIDSLLSNQNPKGQTIRFSYENYAKPKIGEAHNFDCEAMVIIENDILLFSKNRKDWSTDLYLLNDSNKKQITKKLHSKKLQSQITDAHYDHDNDLLYLLSYRYKNPLNFSCYLHIVENFSTNGYSLENLKTFRLDRKLQLESITVDENGIIWIANETVPTNKGRLFYIKPFTY